MKEGLKISLVIPCYNEEKGIAQVLDRVPESVDEVIVVDNASTDRTSQIASEKGAKVIYQAERGYGIALKTGFSAASGDIIVALEGDSTYPVEKVGLLIEELLRGKSKFVSGSRFPLSKKESMCLRNRIGNRILTLFMQILCFRRIRDAMSGMWAFYRNILPELALQSNGIPLSAEIKMKSILNPKIGFKEIHIPYFERIGKSKLHPWRDGLSTLFLMLRLRMRTFSLTPRSRGKQQ